MAIRQRATIEDLYNVHLPHCASFSLDAAWYVGTSDNPTVYRRGDIAEAEPAVPGWPMPVDRLFDRPLGN